uniref:Uncharacterized protein n=1 Tax=Picea glauca TaxID=3330 RepID=A0A101M397_PICGL|nr:hypothetical protein ABT39_MTgene79 [Picea glauca]KUM50261.1 hypothetical protein ABT39_MTgene104 [Picea glauca]QHR90752.1 hypothetical protein Q903MT_gene4778 [Picea sitchensis]
MRRYEREETRMSTLPASYIYQPSFLSRWSSPYRASPSSRWRRWRPLWSSGLTAPLPHHMNSESLSYCREFVPHPTGPLPLVESSLAHPHPIGKIGVFI